MKATGTPGRLKLLAGLIAAFAVWPVAQTVLVRTHQVSPWKLGGWAMYIGPPGQPEVRAYREDANGARSEVDLTTLNVPEEAVRAFRLRRSSLGALTPPDALGLAAVAQLGTDEALILEVTHLVFDAESATFSPRSRMYTYTP